VSVAIWWGVFAIPLFLRVPEPPPQFAPARPRVGLGHGLHPAQGNVPRTALVQARVHAARGLRDLQRRHQHDHPDGGGVRLGNRHPGSLAHPGVRRHPVRRRAFAFMFGALASTSRRSARCCWRWRSTRHQRLRLLRQHDLALLLLGVAVAMVLVGSQALSRSMFATMIPKHKSSQFFAFFASSRSSRRPRPARVRARRAADRHQPARSLRSSVLLDRGLAADEGGRGRGPGRRRAAEGLEEPDRTHTLDCGRRNRPLQTRGRDAGSRRAGRPGGGRAVRSRPRTLAGTRRSGRRVPGAARSGRAARIARARERSGTRRQAEEGSRPAEFGSGAAGPDPSSTQNRGLSYSMPIGRSETAEVLLPPRVRRPTTRGLRARARSSCACVDNRRVARDDERPEPRLGRPGR